MNIKYYETLVEENKKEIKHLNLLLSELEENKRNILEKEYIYEVGRINYYLEKEEKKLEENKLIINSYKIIINELKQIEKLKEYKINDKYDKEQYEYELNKRNEIIEYYKKNIPSTLYIEIEKEINKDKIEENNNTKEEKSDVQEKKENNKNDDVILLSSSTEELNTSKESIENKETQIYANVLTLMGIVAAVFAIITLNFEAFAKAQLDIKFILTMNLSLIFALSVFFGLLYIIINRKEKNGFLIAYIIVLVLILAALVGICFFL